MAYIIIKVMNIGINSLMKIKREINQNEASQKLFCERWNY
jgi:hypothetical protein